MVFQYTTKQGLEEFKKELDFLKNVEMKKIAELIKHTASFGDLKENAAYHDAKEKQAFLQGRILELQSKINSAKIVEKNNNEKIQVGSKVLISLGDEKEKVEIVGSGQADPIKGKISYESPLGKAILNKRVGETLKVDLGGNKVECKILKIE